VKRRRDRRADRACGRRDEAHTRRRQCKHSLARLPRPSLELQRLVGQRIWVAPEDAPADGIWRHLVGGRKRW